MKVHNHSIYRKLVYFSISFLSGLVIVFLIEAYRIDFDLKILDISLYGVITVMMPAAVTAFQSNYSKYVVSKIDNLNEFKKWLFNYLNKFNVELIYESSNLLLFETKEESRLLFLRKKRKSYYKVIIKNAKASIEGPLYKKPKQIQE